MLEGFPAIAVIHELFELVVTDPNASDFAKAKCAEKMALAALSITAEFGEFSTPYLRGKR